MSERRYALSPSKIGTWLDCPRKFYLQVVEPQRISGAWAHLSLGNAIHYALRDWWDIAPAERTRDRMASLMREHWQADGFRDTEQSDRWCAAAADMAWRYVADLEPGYEPHSCERSLGARTAHHVINGRIDRLDRADGDSLVVVDYKTGKRVPTEDDVRGSMALAIYAMCVRQSLRRPCARVELHHIPSGVRVGWDLSEESLDRQVRRIEQIGTEMEQAEAAWRADGDVDAHFAPNPGPLCGWCDLREWCPQAGGAKQPAWAGLPEAVDA